MTTNKALVGIGILIAVWVVVWLLVKGRGAYDRLSQKQRDRFIAWRDRVATSILILSMLAVVTAWVGMLVVGWRFDSPTR